MLKKYSLKNHSGRSYISLARSHITKKRILVVILMLIATAMIIPAVTYAKYSRDIGDRERLMNKNSTGIILRDKNGQIFYEYGKISGDDDIPLSQISDNFEHALIASEDQSFWTHDGYSLKGIASAAIANAFNKDATKYGGSTITQQLVKNKLLSADKSYLRKYQELSMAVAIERKYSKDEILEMYINSVYYGEGAFGITDASKTYFNKSPQDLSLAESSMLVGLLPSPSIYSPISGDVEKSNVQQKRVLERMSEHGSITQAERDTALSNKLTYNTNEDRAQKHAQHFASMVIDGLKQQYGEETIIRQGYDVTTTLDLEWQKKAEENARERVASLSSAGARNAGVVAADPKNGEIRVLVGSVDWDNPVFGKVNMATSLRQPGSSFKPIYYTEALDRKLITPATIMQDQPKTYGGNYKPTNYDFKYRGNISVRNALAQSLNIPAVDVIQKLGVQEAVDTAQRMGISSVNDAEKYGLTLALGTAEVKLTDMVHAYTSLANNGVQHESIMITAVRDKYKNSVYEYKSDKEFKPTQVTSPQAAYLMSSILSDNKARAPTFGNNLTIGDRKVAVKTGTTNDSKDAWTIGYTPSMVVGVWMGNNENQAMVGLAGSSSAGGVWKETMTDILGNTPNEEFTKPDNIVTAKVCNQSAPSLSGTQNPSEEYFIKGTETNSDCNKKKELQQNPKPSEPIKEPQQRKEEQHKNNENQIKPRNREDNNTNNNRETEQSESDTGRGAEEGTVENQTNEPSATPPSGSP